MDDHDDLQDTGVVWYVCCATLVRHDQWGRLPPPLVNSGGGYPPPLVMTVGGGYPIPPPLVMTTLVRLE